MQLLFRGRDCREFARISIGGIIRQWLLLTKLQARIALSVDCTNGGFSFLASSFPQLPANMLFALVQLLFRRRDCWEIAPISIGGIIRRWWLLTNLQARNDLCVDCTNGGFAFLSSSFHQRPANMLFALVQLFFRGRVCREIARISIGGIIRRWWLLTNLQARTALCVDCTKGGFSFLASSFPQLPANLYFALGQLLFRGKDCGNLPEFPLAALYGDGGC